MSQGGTKSLVHSKLSFLNELPRNKFETRLSGNCEVEGRFCGGKGAEIEFQVTFLTLNLVFHIIQAMIEYEKIH